ncbi:MAG TPA: HAMP domain-containing sensor histidine kinase [Bacteroidales bacterium]|nr:HAMP domain-containing sensor histidine kinase [Bacteroidales bacterium]
MITQKGIGQSSSRDIYNISRKIKPVINTSSKSNREIEQKNDINGLNRKSGVADFKSNNDLIFQISSLPYFILSANGSILSSNKAGEELLQRDVNELRLLNFKDFIKGSYRFQIDILISNALHKGTKEVCEVNLQIVDREIPVRINAFANLQTFECIFELVDLSEKRRLQESYEKELTHLNELSEKFQELNATKDKFFSIIAHDLKNPFNSILGFSELLLKNIGNYSLDEIEKFAAIIFETSQRTYNLLENLLLWSRSQTGKIEFNPDVYVLNKLVEENIELIRPMALNKQIEINFLPNGCYKVLVDKNMIDTVLRNLLTNAIKFSYSHSIIEVSIYEADRNIVVSIKDSGIGISSEDLGKLFRLDSKLSVAGTNKERGSGLGLLLSREFVERNYGKIEVTSEIGKGSEFKVILPKARI